MNSLSWFLLLADLAENFSHGLIPLIMLSGILAAGCTLFGVMCKADREEEMAQRLWKWAPRAAIICAVCIVLKLLVPSKQTLMFIAASEFGEKVYTSDKTQRILNPAIEALETYLHEYIEEKKARKK